MSAYDDFKNAQLAYDYMSEPEWDDEEREEDDHFDEPEWEEDLNAECAW